jgi:hypothetical protein
MRLLPADATFTVHLVVDIRKLPAIVLALLACLTAFAADAPRPNIVFIISDDHAWTDYGFMGHPHIETPHLDRLAAQSALFPRGYVPTALCRPALASLATGLYAHQHRITGNDPAQLPETRARDRPAACRRRERSLPGLA